MRGFERSVSTNQILAGNMSVVLHRKHFVVDKKPFFQHFYPKDLAITAARSVVIQGLNVVNEYISTMDLSDHENSDDSDKDDVDERTIFELPAARDFYVSCTKLFVKSLSISTCLRCAEVTCIRIFSVPTVSKLIKGMCISYERLHLFGIKWFIRCWTLCGTKIQSNRKSK